MRKEDKIFYAGLILMQLRRMAIEMDDAKDRLIGIAINGEDHPMALESANQYFDDAFKLLKEDRDKNFYLMTESSSGSMLRYFDDEPEEVEEPEKKTYFLNLVKTKTEYESTEVEAWNEEDAVLKAHTEVYQRNVDDEQEEIEWTLESVEDSNNKELWNRHKVSGKRESRKR